MSITPSELILQLEIIRNYYQNIKADEKEIYIYIHNLIDELKLLTGTSEDYTEDFAQITKIISSIFPNQDNIIVQSPILSLPLKRLSTTAQENLPVISYNYNTIMDNIGILTRIQQQIYTGRRILVMHNLDDFKLANNNISGMKIDLSTNIIEEIAQGAHGLEYYDTDCDIIRKIWSTPTMSKRLKLYFVNSDKKITRILNIDELNKWCPQKPINIVAPSITGTTTTVTGKPTGTTTTVTGKPTGTTTTVTGKLTGTTTTVTGKPTGTTTTVTAKPTGTTTTVTAKPTGTTTTNPTVDTSPNSKIKVLSYNVSHFAMQGTNNNPKIKQCTMEPGQSYTTCLKNVAAFIEANGPYDFVGLQDATNWNQLIKLSPTRLDNMKYVHNNPSNKGSNQVTFYDSSKYTLDKDIAIIKTFMSSQRKPLTILFFNNNLCVINLHADFHNNPNTGNADYLDLDFHIEQTFVHIKKIKNRLVLYKAPSTFQPAYNSDVVITNSNDKPVSIDKVEDIIKTKLQTYNIILMGDFGVKIKDPIIYFKNYEKNHHVYESVERGEGSKPATLINVKKERYTSTYFNDISGRTFYGIHNTASCCDFDFNQSISSGTPGSHILYTKQTEGDTRTVIDLKNKIYKPAVSPASTHLPIIAEFTL